VFTLFNSAETENPAAAKLKYTLSDEEQERCFDYITQVALSGLDEDVDDTRPAEEQDVLEG